MYPGLTLYCASRPWEQLAQATNIAAIFKVEHFHFLFVLQGLTGVGLFNVLLSSFEVSAIGIRIGIGSRLANDGLY
jgi:hypothetical protein